MDNLDLKTQMPKNLVMNILSFIINILIGLWIIPYLVKHIGVAAYGLVPLAMFFAEYISIIIHSLNSAIGRFLLIALQRKDYNQANKIFNTSLVIILLLASFQLLIMMFLLSDISSFINIPNGLVNDAYWLFLFTFLGFSFSLFRGVFSTSIFAHNRLDIQRMIDIVYIIVRAVIIIFLFTSHEANLKYIGMASFFAALLAFVLTFYFSKKFAPELKIQFSSFDKNRVSELSKMGGWILVNQVGFLLFLKVDLYIINKFLGTLQAGEYSILIQWNNLLRTMASVFSGILTPVIMIYYARNEIDKLIDMLKKGVKFMGLFMVIPIGIVSALSGDILTVWMGEEFRYLENLMMLSLFPLVINLSILPLFAVNSAYNRVKIPAIVSLVLGILNAILVIFFVKYTDFGLYGVILVGAIVLTLKNAIFTPIYASYILKISKITFISSQSVSIVFFIFIFIITKLFNHFISSDNLSSLFITVCLSGIVCMIVFLLYMFNDKDMKDITYRLLIKLKLSKYLSR